MKHVIRGLAAGVLTAGLVLSAATAAVAQTVVGVSWSNFQEERWKTDEAAMKAELERLGATYISADAQSSNEKQIADIEGLIARGATALIILAQDASAIVPGIEKAKAEGIPVVGYDRLIEVPDVFYLTFDNKEVGRIQAREVLKAQPKGNYVFIKGSSADPNADFLHSGQLEVLDAAIKAGDIKVVGEQYTDGWLPENAQKNMEQILTANDNKVDAVVASNDGTAGGVVAALTAQGMEGLPVSGQDGDHAALNRVAKGLQTVSVWKDARELGKAAAAIAVELGSGTMANKVAGATKWSGGPKGVTMDAIFLTPVPITSENLGLVIDAGWVGKDVACQGVEAAKAPAACK
ncbi:D-xylose ABC transporter substrate-binding protein [Pelagibius litoralis]|uniref:D-xylose-binding periplasmic protein n=1 Tax=Pelagibius litoralis TaxID=374515 RepID=A0A967CA75_9PROT|nr:D-xylose ABC transporter substrate-binding protein [Pelagibius litoralis]NIA67483.1 D-xylose ABC transporter substrate-binding protein [Pelagibius litoralis]